MVGEWSDVISGIKAARPGLDDLMARCAVGGIDAVVIVKLDRIGRSVLNIVSLVQKLTAMGVGLVCTSQGIDTRKDNPAGKMMLGVMASFAEFERDILRERTRAGLRVARKNGKVLGRPSPTLVADPARSEIIAAWLVEGGRGVRELAKRLGGVSVATAAKLANQTKLVAT